MKTFTIATKDPTVQPPLQGCAFDNGTVALDNKMFASSLLQLKEWMKSQKPNQYMMEVEDVELADA